MPPMTGQPAHGCAAREQMQSWRDWAARMRDNPCRACDPGDEGGELWGEIVDEMDAALASPCCVSATDQEQVKEAGNALVTLARRNLIRYSHPLEEHLARCDCDHCKAVRGWKAALALLGSNEEGKP